MAPRHRAAVPVIRRLDPAVWILAITLFAMACDDPFGPSFPQRIDDVVAGANHTCAIGNNGHTYCWGDDRFGQLGARMEESCRGDQCLRPVPLAGGLPLTDLALGEAHTCGIANLKAYCWGFDRHGQLGSDDMVPERCGLSPAFRCAVVPRRAAVGFPMVGITAASTHSCGVASAGQLFCWGRNLGMQLGTGDTDEQRRPVVLESGLEFRGVTTGNAHTCAIALPNVAYCWGYGSSGRLGTGDSEDRAAPARVGGQEIRRLWQQLDAGAGHTCGVETNSVTSCWGLNSEGQLGNGDRTSRGRPSPVDVPGGSTMVSAGDFHSCAVALNGALYCWGSNSRGQLGLGAAGRQLRPTHVPIHVPVARVSAGEAHTCATTVDGALYCWGANDFGQLGDGTRIDRSSPVRIDF